MIAVKSWRFACVGVVCIMAQSLVAESPESDFEVREEDNAEWKQYKNNDELCYFKDGVPDICWNKDIKFDNTGVTIECELRAAADGDEIDVYAGESLLTYCIKRTSTKVSCSTEVQQVDRYANKTFSCRLRQHSSSKYFVINMFTILDYGTPSKPNVTQNDKQLDCVVEKPRPGSILELIRGKGDGQTLVINNHTSGDTLQVQYIFFESVHETVTCRHSYLSGSSNAMEIDVQIEVPVVVDYLKLAVYGIIAVAIFSVICLVICVCCRRSKKRKDKLISTESTQDIFSRPVPKNEVENQCDYAVPVPKSRRNVTEEYAMVVPKNKRPNYAEPAYADPCDLQQDPVYMDIGSALYASISGSNHYAEVGGCNNSNNSEEVQYASLSEFPCYANSEAMHRNGQHFTSDEPTYAEIKYETGPKPMPKPRLKPRGTGRYVEMI